jgi:uncharacterized protein (TIGR02271 family)
MLDPNNANAVIGTTAYGSDGEKIGKVGQLFLDDATERPEFVTINTGLFGTKETFVPVADATHDGDRLTVPFTKEAVKGAPNVDPEGGHLSEQDEQVLYDYYGMASSHTDPSARGTQTYADTDTHTDTHTGTGTGLGTGTGVGTGTGHDTHTGGVDTSAGHDVSGPDTDNAMTRSEEHLEVGTTTETAGRARLRKYVTTEQETRTVPVRKERAVLETEPVTEANAGAAHDGPAISEEEHEVTLHEDRVVVDTEATPVERVRLGTETVTEEETVSGEVRKEQIETEGDAGRL